MNEILTTKEVASHLRVPEKAIVDMAANGTIPALLVGNKWRVRRTDLDAWVARGVGAAPAPVRLAEVSVRPARDVAPASRGVGPSAITEKVTTEEMHRRIVEALGTKVVRHSPLDEKPLDLDLKAPLPSHLRVYAYNATRPPGGRPLGEHKIQIIVPGQSRGERGDFDQGGGRIAILLGYAAEEDVFVLWDASLYSAFAWSRNVQVKPDTIVSAAAGRIALQRRVLRPPQAEPVTETVLAAPADMLAKALADRVRMTRERMGAD